MFRNAPIRTQILGAFAAVAFACLGAGAATYIVSRGLVGGLDAVGERRFPAALALAKVDTAQLRAARAEAILFRKNMEDPGLRRQSFKDIEEAEKQAIEGRREFEAIPSAPETLTAWKNFLSAHEAWARDSALTVERLRERDRLLEGGKDMDSPEQKALYARTFQAWSAQNHSFVSAAEALRLVREANAAEVALATAEGHQASRFAAAVPFLAVALMLLVLGLGWLVVRNVGAALASAIAETRRVRDAVADGHLSIRADTSPVHPDLRPVVDGFNEVLEGFAPLQLTVAYLTRLSRGELPKPIDKEYRGDFELLKNGLNDFIATVHQRGRDLNQLLEAAARGDLSTRADTSKYAGYNAKLLDSINSLIDRLVEPLRLASSYLERIARGDVPPRIEEQWQGELNQVRESLNTCVDAVNALVADATHLAEASAGGRLDARADASLHRGDFRKIVEGMNASLDAVARPVKATAEALERISRGDPPPPLEESFQGGFDEIRHSLNRVIGALEVLSSEMDSVISGARDGDSGRRASLDHAQGTYRHILEGVNGALDAMAAPVSDALQALERLSRRDLRARVEGDYHRDHGRLKDAVNGTADALREALGRVASSVEQVSAASSQIAASSRAVADGASQQASSIEETSSSLESMASMAKQAADNAQQANALARSAKDAAVDGSGAMEQMVGAMGRIRASAEGT
ncbi:MAG TPA: HAMP domain-containing protein, partial [Anaeromyxobacteraceae bacterium]|nr:HAMP domain-containing protein [Anaeromyxobacteraceae bacterium]